MSNAVREEMHLLASVYRCAVLRATMIAERKVRSFVRNEITNVCVLDHLQPSSSHHLLARLFDSTKRFKQKQFRESGYGAQIAVGPVHVRRDVHVTCSRTKDGINPTPQIHISINLIHSRVDTRNRNIARFDKLENWRADSWLIVQSRALTARLSGDHSKFLAVISSHMLDANLLDAKIRSGIIPEITSVKNVERDCRAKRFRGSRRVVVRRQQGKQKI